jgi:hypothetical protein
MSGGRPGPLPKGAYRTQSGKYAARYYERGLSIYIGSFATIDEAAEAAAEAQRGALKMREGIGSVHRNRPGYFFALGPGPERKYLGHFSSRWAARMALLAQATRPTVQQADRHLDGLGLNGEGETAQQDQVRALFPRGRTTHAREGRRVAD